MIRSRTAGVLYPGEPLSLFSKNSLARRLTETEPKKRPEMKWKCKKVSRKPIEGKTKAHNLGERFPQLIGEINLVQHMKKYRWSRLQHQPRRIHGVLDAREHKKRPTLGLRFLGKRLTERKSCASPFNTHMWRLASPSVTNVILALPSSVLGTRPAYIAALRIWLC